MRKSFPIPNYRNLHSHNYAKTYIEKDILLIYKEYLVAKIPLNCSLPVRSILEFDFYQEGLVLGPLSMLVSCP